MISKNQDQGYKTIEYDVYDIEDIARAIMELRPKCSVFTFSGTLGAGKTTLIQQCLQLCGVQEAVTSPTFAYLNVYTNDLEQTFYHFDVYRIATLRDFQEAGFDEYLYLADSWSFIEWPEAIMPLLTHNVCHVMLDYVDASRRKITITIIA